MKQQTFIDLYQADLETFERYLGTLEKPRRLLFFRNKDGQLRADELERFAPLFRQVCHLQAMAKTRQYSSLLIARLDDLVLRAHQLLYRRKPHFGRQLIGFVVRDFPALVRKEQRYFWLASAIFYLPALIFFLALQSQPEMVYSLLDPFTVENFETMYDPANDVLGEMRDTDSDLAMFGFYIYNNISVAFRTFASGILFGLGSIFFLVFNGLLLGGVLGHLNNVGFIQTITSFVIAHGSFELTAIVIAGAAGMRIGFSLLSPGNQSRLQALKDSSIVAIQLMYGVILMLLVAAFIEGFWSSSASIPLAVKYTVGGLLWLVVGIYLLRSGRDHAAG